jgi:hypothetical protein
MKSAGSIRVILLDKNGLDKKRSARFLPGALIGNQYRLNSPPIHAVRAGISASLTTTGATG